MAGLTLCLDHIALVSAVKTEQAGQKRAAAIVLGPDSQRTGTNFEGTGNPTASRSFAMVGNAGAGLIQGRLNKTTAPGA